MDVTPIDPTDGQLPRLGEEATNVIQRLGDVEPESWQTVFKLQGTDAKDGFKNAKAFLNGVRDEVGDRIELKVSAILSMRRLRAIERAIRRSSVV